MNNENNFENKNFEKDGGNYADIDIFNTSHFDILNQENFYKLNQKIKWTCLFFEDDDEIDEEFIKNYYYSSINL